MEYVITAERKGIWVKIVIEEKVEKKKEKAEKAVDNDDYELVLCLLPSENNTEKENLKK